MSLVCGYTKHLNHIDTYYNKYIPCNSVWRQRRSGDSRSDGISYMYRVFLLDMLRIWDVPVFGMNATKVM